MLLLQIYPGVLFKTSGYFFYNSFACCLVGVSFPPQLEILAELDKKLRFTFELQ
jgi:hypothetical protein